MSKKNKSEKKKENKGNKKTKHTIRETIKKLFTNKEYFNSKKYWQIVEKIIKNQILDDIGENGDITSQLFFNKTDESDAKIIAKENGIMSGGEEIKTIFSKQLNIKLKKKDSEKFKIGDTLIEIKGKTLEILKSERTILNLLAHMCGISTNTRRFIKKLDNKNITIAATRKTIYGALDKKAVITAGAASHRINLEDAILIKDTHLDNFNRKLDTIINKIIENDKNIEKARFIDIEVETKTEAIELAEKIKTLKENNKILAEKIFIIMLDNFELDEIKNTIEELKTKKLRENILIEASGGININNIKQYKNLEIDIISTSAINIKAKKIDLSMKINQKTQK